MRPLFVVCAALAVVGAAGAVLRAPALVTLDGAAGARPGMSVAQVSAGWGRSVRPSYEVRPDCGQAFIDERGLDGYAVFMPRGRFAALFLRRGAVTGRGIRSGSTLAQLKQAYPRLTSRPDRYSHGARNYFLERARAPHWRLRFDVSAAKRVTRIAFGARAAVALDEGCA